MSPSSLSHHTWTAQPLDVIHVPQRLVTAEAKIVIGIALDLAAVTKESPMLAAFCTKPLGIFRQFHSNYLSVALSTVWLSKLFHRPLPYCVVWRAYWLYATVERPTKELHPNHSIC